MTDLTVTVAPQADIVVTIGDVSAVSLLYTGTVGASMTAGETVAYGDVCYVKTDGKLWKAQSDGTIEEAAAQFICIVAAGITANTAGLFAAAGLVSGLSGGAAGSLAYVSATAGATTTTAPVYGTDTTLFTKVVGRWISSTLLYFNADPSVMPQFNG